MESSLSLTFNEDAENYDRWRPGYVPKLFERIMSACDPGGTKRALEIGIGTGQATEPILKAGYHVTAVEVGDRLADYTRQKFAAYPNFHVLNMAFEGFAGMPDTYDLVYSATAFHWIPEQIGYLKALELLKS